MTERITNGVGWKLFVGILLVGIAALLSWWQVTAGAQVDRIDGLELRTWTHETKIEVITTKLDYLTKLVEEIKEEVKRP